MTDPIEEDEFRRKKRRDLQYQQHLVHITDQEKPTASPETTGSMRGGRKVQKLQKSSTAISDVFNQSMQDLLQTRNKE